MAKEEKDQVGHESELGAGVRVKSLTEKRKAWLGKNKHFRKGKSEFGNLSKVRKKNLLLN